MPTCWAALLDLRDLQVLDIMVHRTKMQTIDIDDPTPKVVEQVIRSPYTRVPLWKDEPENIVGVLHTKDLLKELARNGWEPEQIDISSVVAPAWFVPDTTSLKDQLNAFLKRKAQLALVVDEYGEVQGLITLEDILEEIVGQITDEHDVADVQVRMQADGSVNVDGTVAVRDLNRQMDWDLPDEEATTIAGPRHPRSAGPFRTGPSLHVLRLIASRSCARNRNRLTAIRIKPVAERKKDAEPGPQP